MTSAMTNPALKPALLKEFGITYAQSKVRVMLGSTALMNFLRLQNPNFQICARIGLCSSQKVAKYGTKCYLQVFSPLNGHIHFQIFIFIADSHGVSRARVPKQIAKTPCFRTFILGC